MDQDPRNQLQKDQQPRSLDNIIKSNPPQAQPPKPTPNIPKPDPAPRQESSPTPPSTNEIDNLVKSLSSVTPKPEPIRSSPQNIPATPVKPSPSPLPNLNADQNKQPLPPTNPPKPTPNITPAPKPPSIVKSSIRTMKDDIDAIKKGRIPGGVDVQKPQETGFVVPPSPIAPKPSQPTPKKVKVPISKIATFIVVILGIAAGFGAWYYYKNYYVPSSTPTPTPVKTATAVPSATPTPSNVGLETIFPSLSNINLLADKTFGSKFAQSLSPTISPNSPRLFIINNPQTQTQYKLSDFLTGVSVTTPQSFSSASYEMPFYGSLMRKLDGKVSDGLVIKLRDSAKMRGILTSLESSMPQSFKYLLSLDPTKAATQTFQDNAYHGVSIRYRNFADSTLTIDYAIVSNNIGSYLIITNSKDHIYALVDNLLGYVPGK